MPENDRVLSVQREIVKLGDVMPPAARLAFAGAILATVVTDPASTQPEITAAAVCVDILALVIGEGP